MPVLTVGHTEIPYQVRYSERAARKRVVVTPSGVEVVAPAGTAMEGVKGVLQFVDRKRRWIFDSVREVREKQRRLLTQHYASGAKLQYRGRWLMLHVQPAEVDAVEIQCRSKLEVTVPARLSADERSTAMRAAFDAWLRARALHDLLRFGRHHQRAVGVEAAGYRLSESTTAWGTCGKDGIVRVHWRLIQAPAAAMEYVVAHEVVHLVHRHHAPEFWRLLAQTMPDWAERKAMLERWEGEHRAV